VIVSVAKLGDSGSPQRRAGLIRFTSVPMGAGWCAIARPRPSLHLGNGRLDYPRVGDEDEDEKLNDFDLDEY
jgi:hypothetical protein